MVAAHFFWITTVCVLEFWWGKLLFRQARRIAELEERLGLLSTWDRTQWMLYGESMSFFLLLLICTCLLVGFYWRELVRVRGWEALYASVTHELRTPLASIRLQAESIEAGLQDPSAKKMIQRLLEDSFRLELQIQRTLELARLESGGKLCQESISLKRWLEQFLETLQFYEVGERFKIRQQLQEAWVWADPFALEMIFKNIFENIRKHSGHPVAKVEVLVRLVSGAHGVTVEVSDSGKGYQGSPRALGTLFAKGAFSAGTGVGLYLVKKLMKQMGGQVHFESTVGFQVILKFPLGSFHD
jgi:signal transduction histidine kinase